MERQTETETEDRRIDKIGRQTDRRTDRQRSQAFGADQDVAMECFPSCSGQRRSSSRSTALEVFLTHIALNHIVEDEMLCASRACLADNLILCLDSICKQRLHTHGNPELD